MNKILLPIISLFRRMPVLLTAILFGMVFEPLNAAIFTWDGGGGDSNWTTPANWNPDTTPPSDYSADIKFAGTLRTAVAVNAVQNVKSVAIVNNAPEFSFNGSQFNVSTGITVGTNTAANFDNAITLTGTAPFLTVGYGGAARFSKTVTSTNPIVITSQNGAGAVRFMTGGVLNCPTVTVKTSYLNWSLQLDHAAAFPATTNLVLNDASGATYKASVNLNFSSSEVLVVNSLTINGTPVAAGVYSAAQLAPQIAGTGNIKVGTATGSTLTPLTSWVEWGPAWGYGGLTVDRFNCEALVCPQPGDIDNNPGYLGRGMIEWRAIASASDGSIDFLNATTFPRVAESLSSHQYFGMTEHLVTYFKASDTATSTAVLNFTSAPAAANVWLNEDPVTSTGRTVVLTPGWNRLVVTSRSQRTVSGYPWSAWTLKVTLSNGPSGIQFSTVDPERKVLVTDTQKAFRYLTSVTRASDGEFPVFTRGETVSVNYVTQLGVGNGSNYQAPANRATQTMSGSPWVYSVDPALVPAGNAAWTVVPEANWTQYKPVKAHVFVLDDRGVLIKDQTSTLSFGAVANGLITASFSLNLGVAGVGHYRVFTDFLDASDKVLLRGDDHSISVTTSLSTAADQKPRSLGVIGHWLYNAGVTAPRMRWLKKVGITQQQKFVQSWPLWGVTQNGAGVVTVGTSSVVDELIASANANGVKITGDGIEGFYSASANNILTPGGGALPAYGTAAWDQTYYDYGYKLALKYASSISWWGGSNEIDASVGTAAGAAQHVRAAQQFKAGMKAANPNALYVSSSTYSDRPALWAAGFLNVPDIVDTHTHPYITVENPASSSLYYPSSDGRNLMIAKGYTGKLLYGEMSSPRQHNIRGAIGHAGDMVKQLAWAIKWRDAASTPVVGLRYLAAYNGIDYANMLGFNTRYGDPLPIVNAANTASRFLDARDVLGDVSGLPANVSHIRVTSADASFPQTIVAWTRDNTNKRLMLSASGTQYKIVDIYGRETVKTVSSGRAYVDITPIPVFLLGNFN